MQSHSWAQQEQEAQVTSRMDLCVPEPRSRKVLEDRRGMRTGILMKLLGRVCLPSWISAFLLDLERARVQQLPRRLVKNLMEKTSPKVSSETPQVRHSWSKLSHIKQERTKRGSESCWGKEEAQPPPCQSLLEVSPKEKLNPRREKTLGPC